MLYFISAEIINVKEYVPPYLDPLIEDQDLITGVSFASGATGLDPFTSTINVCTTYSLLYMLLNTSHCFVLLRTDMSILISLDGHTYDRSVGNVFKLHHETSCIGG